MKLMKKIFVLLFISGIFQNVAFALDGGALINNDTSFKTNKNQNFYLNQKDIVTAWIKVPFGNNPENYFIAEGLYKFEYNQNLKKSFNYIDLNIFKATYTLHFADNSVKFNLGRFFVSTLSPIIFSQNSDGLSVAFNNNFISASAYCGYTGLLNENIVKMVNVPDFKEINSKKIYNLADKYLVTAETVSFQNLFANQTLGVQFTGAFRMDEVENTRLYTTLLLNGPIASNLIYNLDATAAFTKYNKEEIKVSALAKFVLGYYFDNASVNATVVYASDDFSAISSYAALNNLTEPEYTGIFKPGITATYKPLDNLLITAGFDAAFDTVKSFELKGIQYNVGVDYQILSDIYAGVKWNQYFDINKSDVNFSCVSVQVKVAF